MEVIVERPAALDVHNPSVTACVRAPGAGRRPIEHVAEFQTTVRGRRRSRGPSATESQWHGRAQATDRALKHQHAHHRSSGFPTGEPASRGAVSPPGALTAHSLRRLSPGRTGAAALFAAADRGHGASYAPDCPDRRRPRRIPACGARPARSRGLRRDRRKRDGRRCLGGRGPRAADAGAARHRASDIDGIRVAALLTAAHRSLAVVLTSSRDAADCQPLLASCGARGFIAKAELSGAALAALGA
jgi:hypothetical protein